jgi:hypothetical protein
MARLTGLALVWFALGVCPAVAEVWDKVPTIQSSFLWSAAIAILCWLAARIRHWLPLLLAPSIWFLAAAIVVELNDPHVGPGVRRELGDIYLALQYLFAAATALMPIVAWLLARRKQPNSD